MEFSENKRYLKENPLKPVGDILILAGDVVPFNLIDEHDDFFDCISGNFDLTYWIPGNHEYYHSDLAKREGRLYEEIRNNIFLVNNFSVTHDNVRFIFSTLWTKISTQNQWTVQQGLSDFQVISYKGERLTAEKYNQQHEIGLSFISDKLDEKNNNTIVVTHHVPTLMNYPEKYKGDVLNEAFAVELCDLIESSEATYWIYGHHHQYVASFKIGKTNMVSNQLGYVQYREHLGFDGGCIITVND